MNMAKPDSDGLSIKDKVDLFKRGLGFEGLADSAIQELAQLATVKSYAKGDIIFLPNEPCHHFQIVARGLVKVSIYAPSGFRLTYLLAEQGEPLNLIGPFTGAIRPISAEALKKSLILCINREEFISVAFNYPIIFSNSISILGRAIDSANRRILDMVDKRVEQRLARVLSTLHTKFGSTLNFTSSELAELTGTTTESALRALGRFRKIGAIRSGRATIQILNAGLLASDEQEKLWL